MSYCTILLPLFISVIGITIVESSLIYYHNAKLFDKSALLEPPGTLKAKSLPECINYCQKTMGCQAVNYSYKTKKAQGFCSRLRYGIQASNIKISDVDGIAHVGVDKKNGVKNGKTIDNPVTVYPMAQLTLKAISTEWADSLSSCIRKCNRNKICVSVNYYQTTCNLMDTKLVASDNMGTIAGVENIHIVLNDAPSPKPIPSQSPMSVTSGIANNPANAKKSIGKFSSGQCIDRCTKTKSIWGSNSKYQMCVKQCENEHAMCMHITISIMCPIGFSTRTSAASPIRPGTTVSRVGKSQSVASSSRPVFTAAGGQRAHTGQAQPSPPAEPAGLAEDRELTDEGAPEVSDGNEGSSSNMIGTARSDSPTEPEPVSSDRTEDATNSDNAKHGETVPEHETIILDPVHHQPHDGSSRNGHDEISMMYPEFVRQPGVSRSYESTLPRSSGHVAIHTDISSGHNPTLPGSSPSSPTSFNPGHVDFSVMFPELAGKQQSVHRSNAGDSPAISPTENPGLIGHDTTSNPTTESTSTDHQGSQSETSQSLKDDQHQRSVSDISPVHNQQEHHAQNTVESHTENFPSLKSDFTSSNPEHGQAAISGQDGALGTGVMPNTKHPVEHTITDTMTKAYSDRETQTSDHEVQNGPEGHSSGGTVSSPAHVGPTQADAATKQGLLKGKRDQVIQPGSSSNFPSAKPEFIDIKGCRLAVYKHQVLVDPIGKESLRVGPNHQTVLSLPNAVVRCISRGKVTGGVQPCDSFNYQKPKMVMFNMKEAKPGYVPTYINAKFSFHVRILKRCKLTWPIPDSEKHLWLDLKRLETKW